MKFNPYNYTIGHRVAKCVRTSTDPVVQPGLSMSPAEMLKATDEGRPIGTMILPDDQFEDGYVDATWDVDLLHRRGVDIIDAWNAEKDAKSNLRHSIDAAVASMQQNHAAAPVPVESKGGE